MDSQKPMIEWFEKEQSFKKLVDGAPLAIFVQLDFCFAYVNPAAVKLFGAQDGAQLLGMPVIERFEEALRETILQRMAFLNDQKGAVPSLKQTCLRLDGSTVMVETNAVPISIEHHHGAVVYMQDINARETCEVAQLQLTRELWKKNQFIETILDNLPIGLAVNYIDEGVASYMNKKFQEIYGWPPEELSNISSFFEKVYPDPKEREKIVTQIMQDIQSGNPERMEWHNMECTTREGSKKRVNAKNIPLYDQNAMISTVQDITEQYELQKQLEQSRRMEALGKLAAGIAHDFNNILHPVLNIAETVQDDLHPDSFHFEQLEQLIQAAHRGAEQVKQILAFSRGSVVEKSSIRAQLVVKEVIRLCRATIPPTITIFQNICEDCPPIIADVTRLHQITMNILMNAYHAVQANNGKIFIELHPVTLSKGTNTVPNGEYVCLQISDSGHGMSAEVKQKIFEPYYTTKQPNKGTGLGLAVVYGLVKEFNAHITVESEEGKGSCFSIYFPIEAKQSECVTEQSAKYVSNTLKQEKDYRAKPGETIVLIDDEEYVINVQSILLKKMGYSVQSFLQTDKALQFFTEYSQNKKDHKPIHLIITDMTMPGISGIDMVQKIKELVPQIPIIVCTGFSDEIDPTTTHTLGIKKLLLKPITKKELAQGVREALDS
jgi:PAS domain S-box-containing protein